MVETSNVSSSVRVSHDQPNRRHSTLTAAPPSAMHQVLGNHHVSVSPGSSINRIALKSIQLSTDDRATFVTLKKSEARCCLEAFNSVPNEALICFEYFNQGGANVIFKILPWPQDSPECGRAFLFVDVRIDSLEVTPIHQHELVNKVLRVNKGLTKTLRCEEVISGFYSHVWPLFVAETTIVVLQQSKDTYTTLSVTLPDRDFTEHLMEHRGVKLYSNVMVDLTSKSDAIGVEEGQNQEQRHLTTQRWGILLPDMSPTTGSTVTLEVKPKWLAQSPTAPMDAVRCRTCALQVEKPKNPEKHICPLRLLESSWDLIHPWILARVTEQVVKHTKAANLPNLEQISKIASHVTTYLTKGNGKALLQHLRSLQINLDPHGILCRSQVRSKDLGTMFDYNLRLAMTLRDCSLYIRVGYNSLGVDSFTTDCKLGDLDFKSADKMRDWADKELDLLNAAAYTREINEDLGCMVAKPPKTKS